MKASKMSELHAGADWSLLEQTHDKFSPPKEERYSERARLLIILFGAIVSWILLIVPAWLLLG